MPTLIAVAVLEHENRFLMRPREPGSSLAGKWEFPGGKIEAGETPAQAAVRECLEETGLAIEVTGEYPRCLQSYRHDEVELHFMKCRLTHPDQTPANGWNWITRDDLDLYDVPEGNRELVSALSSESELEPSDSRNHFRSLRLVMFLSLAATTTFAIALASMHTIIGPLGGVFYAVPLLAILIAHGSFAMGWFILGDDHWAVRGTFAVATFCCTIIALAPIDTMHRSRWITLSLLAVALEVVPLGILRLVGRRCVRPGAVSETANAAQFSIRDLFFVTTLVAAALGVGRLIEFTFVGDVKAAILIFSAIALIGAFVWTFGLSYRWPISLLLIALASSAIGYGISFLENQAVIWSCFGAFTGLTTFGYLCILRMHGYRMGNEKHNSP